MDVMTAARHFILLMLYDLSVAPEVWKWDESDILANRALNSGLTPELETRGVPAPDFSDSLSWAWTGAGLRAEILRTEDRYGPHYFPDADHETVFAYGKHAYIKGTLQAFLGVLPEISSRGERLSTVDDCRSAFEEGSCFYGPGRLQQYVDYVIAERQDFSVNPDLRHRLTVALPQFVVFAQLDDAVSAVEADEELYAFPIQLAANFRTPFTLE